MKERFPGIEWYCDKCNAHLNEQSGFTDRKYIWKCTECGYKNSISEDNISYSYGEIKTCCRCHNRFNTDFARLEFETETYDLSYANFTEPLCEICSVEVINDQELGYYYEDCEVCGKHFDLCEEEQMFERREEHIHSRSIWDSCQKVLCADCAIKALDNEQTEYEDLDYEEEDEPDEESLSVEEAALIWLSKGMDEDYMFGYSWEELEEALK